MRFFAALAVFLLLPAQAALADYDYAYSDGEYVVTLPEAPKVETIWRTDANIPYLDAGTIPDEAALGEIAQFYRRDLAGNGFFRFRATTIKADPKFLERLTRDNIQTLLADEFRNQALRNKKFSYSEGSATLKWGTARAVSSEAGKRTFNTAHLLAGLRTLTVIRIEYTPDNGVYDGYFKLIDGSIDLIRQ